MEYNCILNEYTSSLGQTLFGGTRRAILALLYVIASNSHLREVVRGQRLHCGAHGIEEADVLTDLARKTRNQVYYQANSANPIRRNQGILTKTAGIRDVLRQALEPVKDRVGVAFTMGQSLMGRRERRATSTLWSFGDIGSASHLASRRCRVQAWPGN